MAPVIIGYTYSLKAPEVNGTNWLILGVIIGRNMGKIVCNWVNADKPPQRRIIHSRPVIIPIYDPKLKFLQASTTANKVVQRTLTNPKLTFFFDYRLYLRFFLV
jgi:hypothetical protein